MTCDPNTLSSLSTCLRCLTNAQLIFVRTYLLCQWAQRVAGVAPSAPSAPDITFASNQNNIVVTWTNPSTIGSTNELWKSTDGITFSFFTMVSGGATQATDATGMVAGNIWYYKVRSCNGTNCSAFTSIVSASYNYTSANVATISFPTLVRAFGFFNTNSLAALTSVSLPALKSVIGNIDLSGNASMTTLNVNSLVSVGASFFLGSSNLTGAVSFPALQIINGPHGDLQLQSNTLMTSVSAPNLTIIGGILAFFGCSSLTSFNFNALTSVGAIGSGRLDLGSCTSLTTAGFPALTSVTGDGVTEISVGSCTLLSSWNAPNWLPKNSAAFVKRFNACALNAASVNQVLARGVAAGTTVADYELSGGTNAAPSGQGVADKATLIGAGNTVNTN